LFNSWIDRERAMPKGDNDKGVGAAGTERLYYSDARLLTFEARVVDRGESGRRIYLDRTAFYPTSGGQPNDIGTLGGIRVVDVVDEEARIAHLLEAPLAAEQASGVVDGARRFDHMQQHTGQHLLSAVFEDLFGRRTASVHFGDQLSTVDLEGGPLTPEQIRAAEARANALVTENRPVSVSFEESATAMGLRKPSDRAGVIRIVSIEGLDRSACGGTHVAATGELGAILLRKVEKAKGQLRVEFLCGGRASRQARGDYDLLAGLAQGMSAAIDELPGLVEAQRAELKTVAAARRDAEEQLARYRAAERHAGLVPGPDGTRWIVERLPSGTTDQLRTLALAVADLPRAVFVGVIDSPPTLLLAASADSGVNAGSLLKERVTEVGGRGGGSPRLAQGTVPDSAALAAVLARLLVD
jgi:alanyl-tRNA synthetase